MPTQKAVKGTRKLKRKATKVNNRRRNRGRQPLAFGHFYGQSHKKTRADFDAKRERENEDGRENDLQPSPHKKRRLNEDGSVSHAREAPFGFGQDTEETQRDYELFVEDMNDDGTASDSDDDDDDDDQEASHEREQNPIVPTKPMSAERIVRENERLKSEISHHQNALQSLKDADPEFYQHLQEMDGNLLAFGDDAEYDLGELGDVDEAVEHIQSDQMRKTKQELDGIEDDGVDECIEEYEKEINAELADDNDEEDVVFSDGGSEKDDDKPDAEKAVEPVHDEEEEEEEDDEDAMDDSLFALNVSELQQLIKALEQDNSVDAMQEIIIAFCDFVAVMMNDEGDAKIKISKRSVAVANNAAFQQLLRYCVTKLAPRITKILNITMKQKLQPQNLKTNEQFLPFRGLFLKYFKHLFGFFKDVGDESMQRLFLMHCKQLVHLLLSMSIGMQRLYIKKIAKLWSFGSANVRIDAFVFLYEMGKRMHTDNSDADTQDTTQARLKSVSDTPELLQLFKYMYQSFVTVCKRVSPSTMPGIQFMINCLVEMYSLNPIITYKDAFKRLRSIAFHVKQALFTMDKQLKTAAANNSSKQKKKSVQGTKTKQAKLDTVQSIYNWRFINIIRMWSKVLGAHADRNNSDVHLLYYPFIQICCSVLTLTRSAAYDPGRLILIQSLLDLIQASQRSGMADRRIYAPLAPYLIGIINNPAFAKKINQKKKKQQQKAADKEQQKIDEDEDAKNSDDSDSDDDDDDDVDDEEKAKAKAEKAKAKAEKAANTKVRKRQFNIHYRIKIGHMDFDTPYLHASLVSNAVRLLLVYFSCYSYSISFPEIVFATQVFIRQFLQNAAIPFELKTAVKTLSIKLKENANWISTKRKTVQFSPQDFEKVNAFLALERMSQISPLSKYLKTPQFEALANQCIAGDGGGDDEEEHKNDGDVDGKDLQEQRQQKRKAKKAKNKKLKLKTQTKQNRQKQNEKSVKLLRETYEKQQKSKNVQMMGIGDIVQDLELSD